MSPNPNDDLDLGPPLLLLRDLEEEPPARFVGFVRRRIHRRTAATQVANFSWHLPSSALLELARLLSHFAKTLGRDLNGSKSNQER